MSSNDSNNVVISNFDLKKNENFYSKKVLIKNINNLSLDVILSTQKLDLDFIVNYILNEKCQVTSHEKNIDILTVLEEQSHINRKELLQAIKLSKNDF